MEAHAYAVRAHVCRADAATILQPTRHATPAHVTFGAGLSRRGRPAGKTVMLSVPKNVYNQGRKAVVVVGLEALQRTARMSK